MPHQSSIKNLLKLMKHIRSSSAQHHPTFYPKKTKSETHSLYSKFRDNKKRTQHTANQYDNEITNNKTHNDNQRESYQDIQLNTILECINKQTELKQKLILLQERYQLARALIRRPRDNRGNQILDNYDLVDQEV